MRRVGALLGGILLIGLGLVVSLTGVIEATNSGARFVLTTFAIVVGILCLLSAAHREDGPSFDPSSRLNEHAWTNDEQAWSLGEALGMSLWSFRKTGARLALYALPIPLAAVLGGVAGPKLWRSLALLASASSSIGGRFGEPLTAVKPYVGTALASALMTIAAVVVTAPLLKLCLATLRADTV